MGWLCLKTVDPPTTTGTGRSRREQRDRDAHPELGGPGLFYGGHGVDGDSNWIVADHITKVLTMSRLMRISRTLAHEEFHEKFRRIASSR